MVDQKLADEFAKELGFSEYASVSRDGIAVTCDGVGTKILVAEHFNKFDTIGIDLVAMSANDLLCSGSAPSGFLDYYATGKLDLDKSREIIKGINKGCELAGCKLLGGETAQLKPMFFKEHWFDLAGFMVGRQRKVFDLSSIKPGDSLVGIPSSGVHSNGFSTLRKLLEWGEEWLTPTRIYTKDILGNLDHIKACAHITGGGIHGNLSRIVKEYTLDVSLDSWWESLRDSLSLSSDEFYDIFNCGWGIILVTDCPERLDIEDARIIGEVTQRI